MTQGVKSQSCATKYGVVRERRFARRNAGGSSLLEIPAMMWIVLVVMMMPMLALATMTLKSSLMFAAVQDGANLASKAKTFDVGTADKPSAKTIADNTIRAAAARFSGLRIANVTTRILSTPRPVGSTSSQTAKLTTSADTSRFTYQIETIAEAQIDPLFPVNPRIVGSVPGLSAPIPIAYAARRMAENPQGLNQ